MRICHTPQVKERTLWYQQFHIYFRLHIISHTSHIYLCFCNNQDCYAGFEHAMDSEIESAKNEDALTRQHSQQTRCLIPIPWVAERFWPDIRLRLGISGNVNGLTLSIEKSSLVRWTSCHAEQIQILYE